MTNLNIEVFRDGNPIPEPSEGFPIGSILYPEGEMTARRVINSRTTLFATPYVKNVRVIEGSGIVEVISPNVEGLEMAPVTILGRAGADALQIPANHKHRYTPFEGPFVVREVLTGDHVPQWSDRI